MRHALMFSDPPQLLDPAQDFKIGEVVYSFTVLSRWSADELAAIGVLPVVETEVEVPPGSRVAGETIVNIDGRPVAQPLVEEIPLAELKIAKRADAEAAYAAALAIGYPRVFEGVPETLQCRNEHDRTNWLGLIEKCRFTIGQGLGETPVDPPIRCTSNRQYVVSYVEAHGIMLEILQWAAAVLANLWRLKDEIDAAASSAALNTIDINAGWPATAA